MKELAFKLYRDGQISTGLALEITEMDLVSFLEDCKRRGIESRMGIESVADIKADIDSLTDN